MASHLLLVFFLFATTVSTATTTTTTTTSTPPPLPFCPIQPPFHNTHFNSIIHLLNQTPPFNNWAHFLSLTINPSILPPSFTLFIPADHPSPPDPSLLIYHFVPHRLTLNSLLHLPIGTRLPTLLPTFSLLVTNHSSLNLTINSASITHPDLYRDSLVSVHGITSAFNHTLFGRDPLITPSKEGKKSEPTTRYANPFNDRFFWGTFVIVISVMFLVWKGDGLYTSRPGGWIFILMDFSVFMMHWVLNYGSTTNDGYRVLWSLAPFNLFCATTHFGGRFNHLLHVLGVNLLLFVSLLLDLMD